MTRATTTTLTRKALPRGILRLLVGKVQSRLAPLDEEQLAASPPHPYTFVSMWDASILSMLYQCFYISSPKATNLNDWGLKMSETVSLKPSSVLLIFVFYKIVNCHILITFCRGGPEDIYFVLKSSSTFKMNFIFALLKI